MFTRTFSPKEVLRAKGLYDVDAFQAALEDRVPENSLLSHDLFEGLFARAALVTDIELLDDYPAHYDTYAKRQHRWTRGDWQIARWLLPRVPDAERQSAPNTLPLISRWKIFDNLRRSLVAPSLLLWLVAAWTFLPGSALVVDVVRSRDGQLSGLPARHDEPVDHPRGIPWTSHFWRVWGDFGTNTAQVALTLVFLPHQAWLMVDAIVRAAYRKLISGKRLLEWVTAAQAESGSRHDLVSFSRFMYPVTLFAIVSAILIIAASTASAQLIASPFLIAWAMSPLLAYLISRAGAVRPGNRAMKLNSSERQTIAISCAPHLAFL